VRTTALAAVIHRFGPPEVIRIELVTVPPPGAGQVRIRVHASAVGSWDVRVRSGTNAPLPHLPVVLGAELAGVVESVGPDVTSVQVGEAVFGTTGESLTGACAELVVADACRICRRPRMLTSMEAAAVPMAGCAALEMVEVGDPRAGVRTLVLDASGPVGAWVTQLALEKGAEVAGLVQRHQAAKARLAGMGRVLTSLPTGSPRFDLVLDPVGGELGQAATRLLRPGGTLVSSGEQLERASLERADVSARWVMAVVTSARLKFLSRWIDAGWISVTLGEVLALQDAILAHRKVEGLEPRAPGSVVLRVSD
jgi:NADPH:quinone reductase-like Zn-dependent oxidoreductase